LPRALSNHTAKLSEDGYFTTCPGKLFQCINAVTVLEEQHKQWEVSDSCWDVKDFLIFQQQMMQGSVSCRTA